MTASSTTVKSYCPSTRSCVSRGRASLVSDPDPDKDPRGDQVRGQRECAICCQHGNKCEAAHLEPVAKTQSNHPENLLWLCANHHTAYDKGHYGPRSEDADFVGDHKRILRKFRVRQWRMQAKLSVKLLGVLESCDMLETAREGQ
jgi:hypothetical protein